MRKALAAGVGAALLISACSSNDDRTSASDSNEPAISNSDVAAASQYPHDHLTGFGATVASFIAHHEADPDQQLAAHCCFGPKVKNSANGGTADSYNLAGNPGPLVISLTRQFADGTNETTALGMVQSEDLPPDARLIKTVPAGACKAFVFSSAALGSAAPAKDLGTIMTVTMYPPPEVAAETPYDTARVDTAYEMSSDTSQDGC